MASCPRDGFWIPNLIETYPCGTKAKKEISTEYSITEKLERQIPKSNDDMNDWCVKTCQDREDNRFVELIYKLPRP